MPRTRALGTRAAGHIVSQTRYQGLWWGAERIWTDELVRLKLARCQFAPNGTEVIAPPAGPSARTLERMKEYEGAASVDPVRLGSSERGLFLRLEGLFIVDVPTQDGSNVAKECRAGGMVYELVDEDWEDPDASTENDTSGLDKGKGKARELPDGGGCNACSSPLISDKWLQKFQRRFHKGPPQWTNLPHRKRVPLLPCLHSLPPHEPLQRTRQGG